MKIFGITIGGPKKKTAAEHLYKIFSNKNLFGDKSKEYKEQIHKLLHISQSAMSLPSKKENKKVTAILYYYFKNKPIKSAKLSSSAHHIDVTFTDSSEISLWNSNIPYAYMNEAKIKDNLNNKIECKDIIVPFKLIYFIIKKIRLFDPTFVFYDRETRTKEEMALDAIYKPVQKEKLINLAVDLFEKKN